MRLTLSRATALAAAAALVPASRIESFPWEAAALVWAVVLWRLIAGGDGRGLVRRRVRLVAGGVLALAGAGLLYALATRSGNPLVVLLTAFALVQVFLLLRPQAPFATFLTLLLSSIHVAGAAFLRQDAVTLGVLAVWGALLAWALVLFERHTVGRRPARARGTVRQIVVGSYDALPKGAVRGTVCGLCALGFTAGLLLYVLLPRPPRSDDLEDRGASRGAVGVEVGAEEVGTVPDASNWISGPQESAKGLRLGDIGRIKKDLTPYFEVQMPAGRAPRLRENTYDVYRRGDWTASPEGEGVRAAEALTPREGAGGWIALGRRDDFYRGFGVRISLYRGPQRRLYLERDAVRVRVLRGSGALATVLRRQDNEQIDSFLEMQVGDVLEERVVPPVSDPNALEVCRSDALVAPRASYVTLPPECEPLRAVARGVVGTETNPWRRARRLEAWLESDAFTYTLEMPPVDPDRPVVEFCLRTRRGHCEYFAASMTLLLRALGHPARIVRGFRGGDYLDDRGTWMVRGMHYHAWTEMYLQGLGWIAIDATPPDDQAVDAVEVVTQAADTQSGEADERSWTERFLGYGDRERRQIATAVGRFLKTWLVRPLAFLFGRDGFFAGYVLLAAGLLLAGRRRRKTRLAAAVGVPRKALPAGPYGRALALLARRGCRRRRPQTAREFETSVRRVHPEAGTSFGHLTRFYERERFGGETPNREELAKAKAEVARLGEAVEAARTRR